MSNGNARTDDPRVAFREGAEWWATQANQALVAAVDEAAEKRFPGGDQLHPDGFWGKRPPEGTWPHRYIGRAFVAGAKWQEFYASDFTMFPSDEDIAAAEALTRWPLPSEASA